MASIIIHLAVTVRVLDICGIDTRRDEYLFGNILPDYNMNGDPHYKDLMGEHKFFNLKRFRTEFKEKLCDPVYIGYYLHLVQDMVFRDFMHNTHGFSSVKRENVLKLYGDYQRLNSYLAHKYSVPHELLKNIDFVPSQRYSDFSFNKAEFEEEREKYHNINICPKGEYSFFTPEMADDFIKNATEICQIELDAFKGKNEHINELDYAYLSILC